MRKNLVRCSLAALALLTFAGAASAASVSDPDNDFLASFTGSQAGDLDIRNVTATFDGASVTLRATLDGTVGGSPGSLFVWGINRGGGTPRLSFGMPSIGGDVLFDSVAVFFPDGTARAVTFNAMGAPTITPLANAVTVLGNTITGTVPIALLPGNGFAPEDYVYTLWTRLRVNPAMDGTNAEVADFGPAIRASVPEPASWATMIIGFGLVGGTMRSRRWQRRAAVTA